MMQIRNPQVFIFKINPRDKFPRATNDALYYRKTFKNTAENGILEVVKNLG